MAGTACCPALEGLDLDDIGLGVWAPYGGDIVYLGPY